jgi:hypothetical protein
MTAKAWRGLLEVTQLNRPSGDQVLIEHLASAVAELHLPPAFLKQVQTAVAAAIRRAWQHDADQAVHVTLAAQVQPVEAGQNAQCWGFFLIEKRLEHTGNRRIEVSLYPEGC